MLTTIGFVSERLLKVDLAELKLDAFLITALPNVRYLSGFTGSNGSLLVMRGGAILFTDPRYHIQANAECTCKVKSVRGPMLAHIVQVVKRRRLRRIGFEKTRLSYESYGFLNENLTLGSSLKPVAGLIEEHRMIKSAEEVESIRKSVQVNSEAFLRTMNGVKMPATESEMAAEFEYQMRRLGAQKPAFETIVASGIRSALPHAQPSATAIEANELLLIDMGASLNGYASDMTRMAYFGKPTGKVKRMYQAVLEAQLAAIASIREGVQAGKVDRQAREVLKSKGLDQAFVHSTGHGLGLEIHEPPRIGRKDKTVLKAGMVITVEPGAYLQGFGGIRIEDTVVVTRNGCEILTPTPKELLVL